MRGVSKRARALGRSAVVLAGLGCGKAAEQQPASSPERRGRVAQRCEALELGSEPLDLANARVFVEVVDVSTRDLPQPIGRWLEENTVQVRSSANAVAFPNVPTSTPWGQCVDAVCSATQHTLTLTARLPELPAEPIELSLRIEETAREGAEESAPPVLETTLSARHQEPLVLPPAPSLSDGSIIVTAYLLRRHDDLHRMLECKERQKEAK